MAAMQVRILKIAYREPKQRKEKTIDFLNKILSITEEYASRAYKLTLRQLFYQLVSDETIPNTQNEYFRLGKLLTEARMTGLIDWEIIEDRIRIPQMPNHFADIQELIEAALSSFKLDRWKLQGNYVEVWVEKDALAGILAQITENYHVCLQVNRGYPSTSALHDASLRLKQKDQEEKQTHILYLGDHDPSGEDMVRDITARLEEFGCNVSVKKIALLKKQIKKYRLPPNPAKIKDPRTKGYITEHGSGSWELDALPPDVLTKIVESEIERLLDVKNFEKILRLEKTERSKLREMANNFL